MSKSPLPWLLSVVVFVLPKLALAVDVQAGPIWSQPDAERKCPNVCKAPTKWNGQWRTTVPGRMSVCSCEDPPPPPATGGAHDVEAGPIWNQADAQNKCPNVCKAPEKWNGQWRTTVPNKMSVCGCQAAAPPPPPPATGGAHDVEAGPIWNQADAQNKCPNVCKAPEKWNGQWRTTVPNKMSVCGCQAAAPPPPPHDVEAGPIWNQADAQNKCPNVCKAPEKWNGQWRTTVPNKMSVCGCQG